MKGSRDKKTTRSAGLSVPGVDLEQVETLLEFMNAHDLEEFEYEHKGLHIRLKKASSGEPVSLSSVPPRAFRKRQGSLPIDFATCESRAGKFRMLPLKHTRPCQRSRRSCGRSRWRRSAHHQIADRGHFLFGAEPGSRFIRSRRR